VTSPSSHAHCRQSSLANCMSAFIFCQVSPTFLISFLFFFTSTIEFLDIISLFYITIVFMYFSIMHISYFFWPNVSAITRYDFHYNFIKDFWGLRYFALSNIDNTICKTMSNWVGVRVNGLWLLKWGNPTPLSQSKKTLHMGT